MRMPLIRNGDLLQRTIVVKYASCQNVPSNKRMKTVLLKQMRFCHWNRGKEERRRSCARNRNSYVVNISRVRHIATGSGVHQNVAGGLKVESPQHAGVQASTTCSRVNDRSDLLGCRDGLPGSL